MTKNKYGKLLDMLRKTLGSDWQRIGPSCIYRRGGDFLIQCISCQSSNFDRSYVPATFVQVLAHPADSFSFNFGGRLQKPSGGDYWLSGDVTPPVEEVLSLLKIQSWPILSGPLTVETVEHELDRRSMPQNEPHSACCAGLVYGLCDRTDDARRYFKMAVSNLESLRKSWKRGSLTNVQWVDNALCELETLSNLLGTAQFRVHCEHTSKETAKRLKIA
jgi:hypothetical protein